MLLLRLAWGAAAGVGEKGEPGWGEHVEKLAAAEEPPTHLLTHTAAWQTHQPSPTSTSESPWIKKSENASGECLFQRMPLKASGFGRVCVTPPGGGSTP